MGIDQFGRDQQHVNADKAFIQFAGLTAGRASSFFDFYAHDFEIYGATAGSDVASTNLLAYTATFGNGLSATVSAEDPVYRVNEAAKEATSKAKKRAGDPAYHANEAASDPRAKRKRGQRIWPTEPTRPRR